MHRLRLRTIALLAARAISTCRALYVPVDPGRRITQAPAVLYPRRLHATTSSVSTPTSTAEVVERESLGERAADSLTAPVLARAATQSQDCSQLAKDPTSNPEAYAIACAHHFGTQVPPYTHTPDDLSTTKTTPIKGLTTTKPSHRSSALTKTTSSASPSQRFTYSPSPSTSAQPAAGGGSKHYFHASAIGASVAVIAVIGAVLYFTRRKWLSLVRDGGRERNSREHYSEEMFREKHSRGERGRRMSESTGSSGRRYYGDSDDGERGGDRGGPEMSGALGEPSGLRGGAATGAAPKKSSRYYSLTNPDPASGDSLALPLEPRRESGGVAASPNSGECGGDGKRAFGQGAREMDSDGDPYDDDKNYDEDNEFRGDDFDDLDNNDDDMSPPQTACDSRGHLEAYPDEEDYSDDEAHLRAPAHDRFPHRRETGDLSNCSDDRALSEASFPDNERNDAAYDHPDDYESHGQAIDDAVADIGGPDVFTHSAVKPPPSGVQHYSTAGLHPLAAQS